jgi:adhesin HecA-like repeat protein
MTYWTYDGDQLVSRHHTVYRDIYEPNLGRAGVITSGKALKIRAKNFDNMFGVLNAARQLDIAVLEEVSNECGLIYSGGPMTISGTLLRNGYQHDAEVIHGVDPDDPIQELNRITGRGHYVTKIEMVPHRYHSWGFHHTKYVQEERRVWEHLPDITERITTGYRSQTQYSTASQYP